MKQSIRSRETRQMPATAVEAYAVVSDFTNFPAWFPAPVTLLRATPDVVGNEIEVEAPDGGPRFVMEVTGISPGACIDLCYRGDVSGTGRWRFADGRAALEVDLLNDVNYMHPSTTTTSPHPVERSTSFASLSSG